MLTVRGEPHCDSPELCSHRKMRADANLHNLSIENITRRVIKKTVRHVRTRRCVIARRVGSGLGSRYGNRYRTRTSTDVANGVRTTSSFPALKKRSNHTLGARREPIATKTPKFSTCEPYRPAHFIWLASAYTLQGLNVLQLDVSSGGVAVIAGFHAGQLARSGWLPTTVSCFVPHLVQFGSNRW